MENQCQPLQFHDRKIQRQKDQSKYNERSGEGYQVIFHVIPRSKTIQKTGSAQSRLLRISLAPANDTFPALMSQYSC